MKSTLFSLLALAAFVYCCFCLYLYLFQRSFIYFPTPASTDAPAEALWVENERERIKVWRLHAEREHAIVYFGGNAEDVALNIPEFSEWFSETAVYLVNYRGYGGSSGSPREAALFSDAHAVYALAKKHHAGVSLIGRSLGAAVALEVAASRDVGRLALITPFDSLARLARDFYPIFPTSLLLSDRYDSIPRAEQVRAPVLMMVAGSDEIIPASSTRRLAGAIDASLLAVRVIDGTTHNTIGMSPEYGRALREFMSTRAATAGQ